jgi:hypothetical protein
MKKILLILISVAAMSCSNDSIEKLKSLGTDEFLKDKWANATQEARGKMIYSFIKKHDIHKMIASDIKNLLGPSTAYYNYDEFPAYLVGPENVKTEYGNGFLFAFPIDRNSGKIKKFVILPKIE